MAMVKNGFVWMVIAFIMGSSLFAIWTMHVDGKLWNPPVEFFKAGPDEDFDTPISGGVTHKTTKTLFKKGELVYANVNIKKNRDIAGTIQWNLMDRRYYPYAARQGGVPHGTHHMVVPVETIPEHVPPGQYYFAGYVSYQVNYFSQVFIPMRTNCFEVVE